MVLYKFFNSGIEHWVKTLAYADDICTLFDNDSDYTSLQHHLSQYSDVSNANFNQEKNGSIRYEWMYRELMENITATTTNHSLSQRTNDRTFRYLGFYIVYNNTQTRLIKDKLLTKVKDHVQVYSQRQLLLQYRCLMISGVKQQLLLYDLVI